MVRKGVQVCILLRWCYLSLLRTGRPRCASLLLDCSRVLRLHLSLHRARPLLGRQSCSCRRRCGKFTIDFLELGIATRARRTPPRRASQRGRHFVIETKCRELFPKLLGGRNYGAAVIDGFILDCCIAHEEMNSNGTKLIEETQQIIEHESRQASEKQSRD